MVGKVNSGCLPAIGFTLSLVRLVLRQFDSDLVIGLGNIFFKIDIALYYAEAAADIFKTESHGTLVQFIKIGLHYTASVVVDAEVKLVTVYILGEVDKTCAAMFEDIIDQFLHYAEDDQFFLAFQAVLVFMETAAGIDGA